MFLWWESPWQHQQKCMNSCKSLVSVFVHWRLGYRNLETTCVKRSVEKYYLIKIAESGPEIFGKMTNSLAFLINKYSCFCKSSLKSVNEYNLLFVAKLSQIQLITNIKFINVSLYSLETHKITGVDFNFLKKQRKCTVTDILLNRTK